MLDALKNWEIPDASLYEFHHDKRKWVETMLQQILQYADLKSQKVIINTNLNPPHYQLSIFSSEVKKPENGLSHTALLYFNEGPTLTILLGGIDWEKTNCPLRVINERPLQLKELFESLIPFDLDTKKDLWADFTLGERTEQISEPTRSSTSKTYNIHELTQECLNCNATQPTIRQTCINCSKDLAKCHICKRGFSTKDQISPCPHCANIFHKAHLFAWVQSKGVCAVCKEGITLTQLS